jgi:hypothetical protein
MTRLEEYQAYCTKNGMADTMAGFALFNAWQDAEEKNKWISVKVKLPDCDNEDTGRGVEVSATVQIFGIASDGGYAQSIGDYCDEGTWRHYGGDYDFMYIEEVTHWMPLPTPPKPE